jgi:hypothetical protein
LIGDRTGLNFFVGSIRMSFKKGYHGGVPVPSARAPRVKGGPAGLSLECHAIRLTIASRRSLAAARFRAAAPRQ